MLRCRHARGLGLAQHKFLPRKDRVGRRDPVCGGKTPEVQAIAKCDGIQRIASQNRVTLLWASRAAPVAVFDGRRWLIGAGQQ